MTAVLPLGRAAGLLAKRPTAGWLVPVLAASAAFMFLDPRPEPIQLWDESRVIVNALEMRAHGLSLVTTYADRPDLWNTKPPLLVWAMVMSTRLFGLSLFCLRLPSMLSALGVVAITFGFARRLAGSAWVGALAAALLVLSFGFTSLHAARTADYDAPLTLFTTGYAVLLFRALHRRRPTSRLVAGAAALAFAAVMTKSVAGVIPGLGVAAYAVLAGRPTRLLHVRYLVSFTVAGFVVAAFGWAREGAAPGYLHAALFNDAAGRFSTALDRHGGSPLYYVMLCFGLGFFSAGPLGLAAPAGLAWARGRARLGLLFCLCVAASILGVASSASTKLPQYAVPAYPFLSVACALAAQATLRRFQGRAGTALLAVSALLLIAGASAGLRYLYLPRLAETPGGRYGTLLQALARQDAGRVQLVDGGVTATGVEPGYAPQARAYALIWRERGLDVDGSASASRGDVVATCDPSRLAKVRALGPELSSVPRCAAVRLAR